MLRKKGSHDAAKSWTTDSESWNFSSEIQAVQPDDPHTHCTQRRHTNLFLHLPPVTERLHLHLYFSKSTGPLARLPDATMARYASTSSPSCGKSTGVAPLRGFVIQLRTQTEYPYRRYRQRTKFQRLDVSQFRTGG